MIELAPLAWRGRVEMISCTYCCGWQLEWDDTFSLPDLGAMSLVSAVLAEVDLHLEKCPALKRKKKLRWWRRPTRTGRHSRTAQGSGCAKDPTTAPRSR